MTLDEAKVHEALGRVIDPELGLDVESLGLVYAVECSPGRVHVEMTMTTPACPMGPMIVDDAREAIRALADDEVEVEVEIEIELVWDPPWTPARMSDEAKQKLGWK